MKVTWNWLAEFVELDLPPALIAERLTMSGLEVESITAIGADIATVRCAEVIATRPHPQADRLTICEVRASDETTVRVVCGAPNVRAGLRVAYAAPGTTLPGGRHIEAAEIRGVASAGMLCSEAELGVGSDDDGILELPGDSRIGERVGALLGYEDTVLEIGITPNRGDCLSIIGIARELAALTGQPLRRQRLTVSESKETVGDLLTIGIDATDLCGRYVGRVISGLRIAPSPRWMRYRLQAVGVRAINNVVDVTNYVMLERGQPLHAFDFDRLPQRTITVRRAGNDLSFHTLDGQERALQADDLVIASGAEVVALAGVMGGTNTEVTGTTQRILLESAWFLPSTIRRTSRRLGLKSESSYRFERGTDIAAVTTAADRAAQLLVKHAGGVVASGRIDAYPGARPVATIPLRLARVEELLGMQLGRVEVVTKLKALGMGVTPSTRGALNVVPPTYRTDLSREIDLIEEIVRLTGYQNVPTTLPESSLGGGGESHDRRRLRQLREALAAQGLTECLPLSFCAQRLNGLFPGFTPERRPVDILNPITQDDAQMRLSLCSGLLRALRHNADQAVSRLALFTLGKVFWSDTGYHEARHLGAAIATAIPARGLGAHNAAADFAEIKGIVESVFDLLGVPDSQWQPCPDMPAFHPGKTARILAGGDIVGIAGALHPAAAEELGLDLPCWLFELDLEKLLQYGRAPVIFRELQRFPAVMRDVAVLTKNDFAADRVIRFVDEWRGTQPLVEAVELFDEYSGPPIPAESKSLAYTIAYRAADRTLTDGEVNDAHDALKAALVAALGVELR